MKVGRDRHVISALIVCGLLGVLSLPSIAQAMSKSEQRKLESAAKKAFYSSDYETAKEIYSTLLSEFDDYIYLRNIARCYEQMKQPGAALDNFRAYLKRAGSSLSEQERQEIADRMAAMEKLLAETTEAAPQKQEAAKAQPPAVAPVPEPVPSQPAQVQPVQVQPAQAQLAQVQPVQVQPAQAQLAQVQPSQAQLAQTQPAPVPPVPEAGLPPVPPGARESQASPIGVDLSQPPASPPKSSALKSAGLGLLIAAGVAAIVGGVLMYSAWSTYGANKDGKCGDSSGCASARDSVDSKNLWSKISFGVAAGAAVLGGTFYLIAPSPKDSRDVAIGMSWTY